MNKINKVNKSTEFYKVSLEEEESGSPFYPEYSIFLNTVASVNSFYAWYRTSRKGAKGGPATHKQQDLYRAMLVFACAGLDMLVKQLIKTKLVKLVEFDTNATDKFKDYVKRGLKKDNKDSEILNVIAFALIDRNPREVFLREYISHFTGGSLQSTKELWKVSEASGLEKGKLFPDETEKSLDAAFRVRNEIIHQMDINIAEVKSRTQGFRNRIQREAPTMKKHTENILKVAEDLFRAYKDKFKN